MVSITTGGSFFPKTLRFLERMVQPGTFRSVLEQGAIAGVDALRLATPIDTGLAASSWSYTINVSSGKATIEWLNSDIEDGVSVVLLVQYGHGTGTGGYVQGQDFINPALEPVFSDILDSIIKEVNR